MVITLRVLIWLARPNLNIVALSRVTDLTFDLDGRPRYFISFVVYLFSLLFNY